MRRLEIYSCYIFLALLSCNNIPDCDDPNSLDLVIQFLDSTSAPLDQNISQIRELDNDFVFFENDTLSLITLEINPTDTTTGYVFEGDGISDTLIVNYRQNQMLKSETCGPIIRISQLTIEKQTFADTLIVLNDELLTNQINIEIIR